MDAIAEPGPEPAAHDPSEEDADPVATSRAVERAARRVLESERLDHQDALELRTACEQLAADRTNGENLDGSIRRLRVLLARSRPT